MTTSSSNVQQRYSSLRRRLDQLGYTQPISIECLPLIERLFADLIHTTESLKHSKNPTSNKTRDVSRLSTDIEPYKNDNSKLVKENNTLHQDVIKLKETIQFTKQESKTEMRKLENENTDLKFLNNQYVHKLRQFEKESKEKSDRISQLQEKNFHAVVHTPGGKKKSIPFRRQRMELDSTVPASSTTVPSQSSAEDPYVADLLQVADQRVADLQATFSEQSQILEESQSQLTILEKQVETRNVEIERLSRMLDGGRPTDVVVLEARNRSNERLISQLNIQIDFLQQKNDDLEARLLKSRIANVRDLKDSQEIEEHITYLTDELKRATALAEKAPGGDRVPEKSESEDFEAKIQDELHKSRSELFNLDNQVSSLTEVNNALMVENMDLDRFAKEQESHNIRLQSLLDRVDEDKKHLTQRVNKLSANEKELILEIERLKTRGGALKSKGRIPTKLTVYIRSLEEERDYYRTQTEALEKLIRSPDLPPPLSHDVRCSRSPRRSDSRAHSVSPARKLTPKKNRSQSKPASRIAHYETIIRALQDERDFYKSEMALLRSNMKLHSSEACDEQLARLMRERDDLQGLVDKFERHMSEIQSNIKLMTSDRDQLLSQYNQCKQELQETRAELCKSPKSAQTSLAAQVVLRRVETERDDALADLKRMMLERDGLRDRLKVATETSLSERQRLEKNIASADSDLKKVQLERNDLLCSVDNLKAKLAGVDQRLLEQASRTSAVRDEAVQHETTAHHMKMLATEAERSLEDLQKKLNDTEEELRGREERCTLLDTRVTELLRHSEVAVGEIQQLKNTVANVYRQKDALQVEVDEKAEKIAALQDEAITKERLLSDFKVQVSELESHLEHSSNSLSRKDRELSSLRRQVDDLGGDVSDITRTKDNLYRENKRLQDDLAVMTRENQSLHQELQDTTEDMEELRKQAHLYLSDVKKTEDLLATKESERSDLLEQYRQLSSEFHQYQSGYQNLETESSNLRVELMSKESDISRYRERLEQMSHDIEQHQAAHHKYDLQISQMTRTVSALEEATRKAEDDRKGMVMDLTAMRDLCSQLDSSKDSLQRKLTASQLDKEQLEQVLDEHKTELSALQNQIAIERSNVQNLEALLSSNRERDFQSTIANQEKDNEIQLLKDRLSLNDNKLQSQNREIASLRTRTMEMETEIERTRRKVTNERFERERVVQELRRHTSTTVVRDSSPGRSPSRNRSPSRSFESYTPERLLSGLDPSSSSYS